jgi:hypothetical protein
VPYWFWYASPTTVLELDVDEPELDEDELDEDDDGDDGADELDPFDV